MPPIQRVPNVSGFFAGGQFHPIRSDKKKYDAERAGDFDDIFDKEIRKNRNAKAANKRYEQQLENAIRREVFGDSDDDTGGKTLLQFVRSEGGFKATRYDKGELDFLTFKESGKRGLVSETKGKSLDKMFQSANAAGYDVSDVDDLLKKLSDELGGKVTRQSGGRFDYRRNPSKTMKPKISAAEKKQAARTLAALFPNQTASSVLKKLKKNPSAAELASVAIENFDFNADGDVDENDVRHFAEHPVNEEFVLTPDGEPARILDDNPEGINGVIVEITDGIRTGELEILAPDEIQFLEEPTELVENGIYSRWRARGKAGRQYKKRLRYEAAAARARDRQSEYESDARQNPASIVKVNGAWQIVLPNGRYLRGANDRVFRTTKKSQALEMAGKIPLPQAREIGWLDRLAARKNNPAWLSSFANGSVGILSALQIADRYGKKKPQRRTNPVKVKTKTAFKADLEKVLKRKLTNSPKDKRYLDSFYNDYKKGIAATNAKHATAKKNPTKPATATKPATTAKPKTTNPAKAKVKNPNYKRKAFEMFQGRPATKMLMLPASKHAPKSGVDTAGRLIEIKLVGQEPVNYEHRTRNPLYLGFNKKATRLWIVGGKMGRKNPALKPNEIEVLAPLEYVVYETYKPHIEGDEVERHYIHPMGEVTNEPPDFALDNDGFPVIHGGAYTIEERGIVN